MLQHPMREDIAPSADGHASEWSISGLEHVGPCPICACERRTEEQSQLQDRTFGAAAGVWTLHRCLGCRSLYLDPRPDKNSIGLAYRNYYTHAVPSVGRRRNLGDWLERSSVSDLSGLSSSAR